ncbi:MAG: hypothetical protein U0232_15705 [Thermomicrobiales bacterium]
MSRRDEVELGVADAADDRFAAGEERDEAAGEGEAGLRIADCGLRITGNSSVSV